jgi:hypothetical protein
LTSLYPLLPVILRSKFLAFLIINKQKIRKI